MATPPSWRPRIQPWSATPPPARQTQYPANPPAYLPNELFYRGGLPGIHHAQDEISQIKSTALSLVGASAYTRLSDKANIAAITWGAKFSRSPSHIALLIQSSAVMDKTFTWGMEPPSSDDDITPIPSSRPITVKQIHMISVMDFLAYHVQKATKKITHRSARPGRLV